MITGGCLCGQIRYESDGRALFSVICHCRDCQKASGSFGVPVMGVAMATFKVTGGPKSFGVAGGSGKPALRFFCPDCGSLLFGNPEAAPGVVTIYVGSLDDPGLFVPSEAIFTRDRPHWARTGHALAEHDTTSR
jgi:hypothetical protein